MRTIDRDMSPPQTFLAIIVILLVSSASGQQFNVSSDGGCLRCGDGCLNSVTEALPSCLAPLLMAAGYLKVR